LAHKNACLVKPVCARQNQSCYQDFKVKAKAKDLAVKAKDLAVKTKAKAKDLTVKAKTKAKDLVVKTTSKTTTRGGLLLSMTVNKMCEPHSKNHHALTGNETM
jgi:hypothetical protein